MFLQFWYHADAGEVVPPWRDEDDDGRLSVRLHRPGGLPPHPGPGQREHPVLYRGGRGGHGHRTPSV